MEKSFLLMKELSKSCCLYSKAIQIFMRKDDSFHTSTFGSLSFRLTSKVALLARLASNTLIHLLGVFFLHLFLNELISKDRLLRRVRL